MMRTQTLPHFELFSQASTDQPDSDEPLLRYAAMLDERCDPMGEFIRVQCELPRARTGDPLAWELECREQELLAEFEDDWAAPVRGLVDWWVFRRGFIAEVSLSAAAFLRHAEELFTRAPVQQVHLQRVTADLEQLVDCPWLERIRHLDLSNNPLRDGGAQLLARSPYLGNLTSLNLASTALGNTGLRALAGSARLRSLRELYLCDNRIGAGGVRALAESPLTRQLRVVHLRFNDFGHESAALLRRTFGMRVQI